MKRILYTLATVLVLGTSAVNAQTAEKTASAQPAPSVSNAELTFDKEFHDFGTIEYAANGSYEFKFKNTGTEPLIISDAKGSCGCTVPTYPKNTPIKPGETQSIKVTYDTKRVGNFTKTVTVNSNAKKPVTVITIKGTVKPESTEEVFPIGGKSDNGATPFEKH